ncbi:hypothetical protein E8E12_010774 [Didymella heteroderae]|uniref:R3H domain-containing protein n=1 Tax=Didymella heteroderae TaxID=1769908 RepID=A0A9P4WXN2_9PLEO|nr:hypothetical protein E8E12_010774 [Didymella heteroderae]
MFTHPELIEAWAAAIPHLPRCAKEVHLDVTPAPATTRDQHELFLKKFIHDKCASRIFLGCHVQDVAALVRRVDEHYGGRMKFILTDLEFVGKWVSSEDALWPSLNEAVERMTSRKLMWQGKRSGDKHLMVWLRDVEWNPETLILFARLADEGLEMEAIGDVKIAGFREMQGELELALEPAVSLRRAFQHGVAADLTFRSAGEGDGRERHVVVRQ